MYILNWKKKKTNTKKQTSYICLPSSMHPIANINKKKGRKKKKARYMRIEHIFCTKELFEIEEKMTR